MALLLCNMKVYTRFSRFKHCAMNKEEKHKLMMRTLRNNDKDERDKPMSRTDDAGREAQAQQKSSSAT